MSRINSHNKKHNLFPFVFYIFLFFFNIINAIIKALIYVYELHLNADLTFNGPTISSRNCIIYINFKTSLTASETKHRKVFISHSVQSVTIYSICL